PRERADGRIHAAGKAVARTSHHLLRTRGRTSHQWIRFRSAAKAPHGAGKRGHRQHTTWRRRGGEWREHTLHARDEVVVVHHIGDLDLDEGARLGVAIQAREAIDV